MGCGLKRTEAKVLIFLLKNKSGKSRDIEREMDMRQPEVSSAMNLFKKKHWIKIKTIKPSGKGRPINVYSLSASKQNILTQLKNNLKKEIDKKKEILEKLEEM